jgi:MarR family transcriptional regulator, lower aerobic nicotinate degradation pathway regulator
MSTKADTGTADTTGTSDDRATPTRLRSLPSRLLTQTAMHADRLANQGLAHADARKWHYAVLAVPCQESETASGA